MSYTVAVDFGQAGESDTAETMAEAIARAEGYAREFTKEIQSIRIVKDKLDIDKLPIHQLKGIVAEMALKFSEEVDAAPHELIEEAYESYKSR